MKSDLTDALINNPQIGDHVRVRTRNYLVDDVVLDPGFGTKVTMSCLDDDAQGQMLEVIWEMEIDAQILSETSWKTIGIKGDKHSFDSSSNFSAYLHTLRWNCVTATDPSLFQSPFRAGIKIEAYQLEPLRKALALPRVNLFIADDVGLGKTIEAGLIAVELLLRRRVKEIVVACPPSMLQQWKDEMESRFGLIFEIFNRDYIDRIRQERGYGVNPWTTFPRFLISHKLLIDENYTTPLRDKFSDLRQGTLFILDEAHHAAPSSGSKYAVDSKFTWAIRDISHRFEHRLFLSATPHNGHSNSFSALLELLDDQRFTRGVKVIKENRNSVMVRRSKNDIRQISGGFPKREIVQIDIDQLPADAPELKLSRLLNEYIQVRLARLTGEPKQVQNKANLLFSTLQKRLLSSIEAFSRTLRAERRGMEKIWNGESISTVHNKHSTSSTLLEIGIDADDDRSQLPEDELLNLFDSEVEQLTQFISRNSAVADIDREKYLLDEMQRIAEDERGKPDERIKYLINWIRQNMCSGASLPGLPGSDPDAKWPDAEWEDKRIIIFTEYEDTRRYISNILQAAIEGTDLADHRIQVFHGSTSQDQRESIKRAFNLPPNEHPIRILIATDAAREGLNLQAHCHHLFHFDVPWNPSRLEQRNGRIDRKLQPSPTVYCHYFVYTQRPEDRILKALVNKTEIIRKELGKLSNVIESRLAETLEKAVIRHDDIDNLETEISEIDVETEQQSVANEELEDDDKSIEQLLAEINTLRNRINDARKWIGLDKEHLRNALSSSLEIMGGDKLRSIETPENNPARYRFPDIDKQYGADPSWAVILDSLRKPREYGRKLFEWRRESPLRPVIFEAPNGIDDDVVQLHLSHRIVQRLLGRFLSQGFIHYDLSRACVLLTDDAIPRIILLGRLSLYGQRAVRLHDEIVSITARWIEPENRKNPLSPYARDTEAKTLEMLENAFKANSIFNLSEVQAERFLKNIQKDVEELRPHLQTRSKELEQDATKALLDRGKRESDDFHKLLADQKRRVEKLYNRDPDLQLKLQFQDSEIINALEKKQLEDDRKYWERWLEKVEIDLIEEPKKVRDFYNVTSSRIEPVGIVYLWPVTG